MCLNKDLIFIHLIAVGYIAFQYKDLHFKFSENFFCYLLFPPSGTSGCLSDIESFRFIFQFLYHLFHIFLFPFAVCSRKYLCLYFLVLSECFQHSL